ncbi:immunoglobulin superfamily member 10-like [Anopheles aquasalis]|uniref:immunoglobulin superfamily member 10-like n=1 Tax=Anopheles aquasalis TaxID=42839 RepID=UPI00215B46B8|nr:immunoglobulin superfamily member 10-like [Anopheles aquasalis]
MQYIIIGGLFTLAALQVNSHHAMAEAHQLQTPQENKVVKKFYPHPYFDFDVPRNITTRVGQTAFINCRVEQMGDKSVSWIRKRDLHILSAGTAVYTSDERFQVIRSEKAENWTLQIKFAQQRDSGIYECQVNTEPKMSMAFRLNVVEAKAVILGPTDLYVKMGSIVTLTCIISQGPHDLGTIYWYRGSSLVQPVPLHPSDDALLAYPHRISVELKWTEALTSRLKILGAKLSDSGNYTCLPTSAEGTSVMVHVINGEHPAAMQRGCATNTITDRWRSAQLLAAMLALLALHHCLALQTELSRPPTTGTDCSSHHRRQARWQQRQGEAVWRPPAGAARAAEALLATRTGSSECKVIPNHSTGTISSSAAMVTA